MPVNRLLDKKARTFMSLLQMSETDTNTLGTLNDPLFYEFIPFFHLDAPSGLLAAENFENSALAHLRRIGENDRYQTLRRFRDLLNAMLTDAPWMFKAVAGLGEVKRRVAEPLLVDREISFELFDTIDWRSHALVEMYKSVIYDYERLVEVLPPNLQRFSMSVLIKDARIFSSENSLARRFLGEDSAGLAIDPNSINHKLYHFGKVRFLESSDEETYEDLTDAEYSEKSIFVRMEYKIVRESALFKAITGNLPISADTKNIPLARVYDNRIDRFSPVLQQLNRVEDIARDLTNFDLQAERLRGLANNLTDEAITFTGRTIESVINRQLLGNVYQRDIADFFNLLEAQTSGQLRNVYQQGNN